MGFKRNGDSEVIKYFQAKHHIFHNILIKRVSEQLREMLTEKVITLPKIFEEQD
jgi:hypothetical protein